MHLDALERGRPPDLPEVQPSWNVFLMFKKWFGHLERKSVDDWVSACRGLVVEGSGQE